MRYIMLCTNMFRRSPNLADNPLDSRVSVGPDGFRGAAFWHVQASHMMMHRPESAQLGLEAGMLCRTACGAAVAPVPEIRMLVTCLDGQTGQRDGRESE